MLRKHGVVGKFVEFYGDGLDSLPLAGSRHHCQCRQNMVPPVASSNRCCHRDYMRLSGRSEDQVELVEKYAKAQGMWRNPGDEPIFTSVLELDMNDVEASLAGPKRPQDRVALPMYQKHLLPVANWK